MTTLQISIFCYFLCLFFFRGIGQSITCNCSLTNHTHIHHFLLTCDWKDIPVPAWTAIYGKDKIDNYAECIQQIGSPGCHSGINGNCYYLKFPINSGNGEEEMIPTKPHLSDGETYYIFVWQGTDATCSIFLASYDFQCYVDEEYYGPELTPLVFIIGTVLFILVFVGLGLIRWNDYQNRDEPPLQLHSLNSTYINQDNADDKRSTSDEDDTIEDVYLSKVVPEVYLDSCTEDEVGEIKEDDKEGKEEFGDFVKAEDELRNEEF